jgi:two-component system, NarL family, sensor histidine kinase DesK
MQVQRLALAAVEVDFEYDAEPLDLHPELETALALALRESATNVIRHAQAHRCRARIARDGDAVLLEVRDDGLGGARADGNGLRGIAERAEALGGELELDSPPGHGTTLVVRMPYRPAPPESTAPLPAKPRLAIVR